jgi:hypothetical protein
VHDVLTAGGPPGPQSGVDGPVGLLAMEVFARSCVRINKLRVANSLRYLCIMVLLIAVFTSRVYLFQSSHFRVMLSRNESCKEGDVVMAPDL